MIRRKLLIATAIIGSVSITACSDTAAPKKVVPGLAAAEVAAAEGARSLSESSLRSGALHVTKECSQYTRLAGGFCTITSSNLKDIEVGTRVVYAVASGATVLNSDVTAMSSSILRVVREWSPSRAGPGSSLGSRPASLSRA